MRGFLCNSAETRQRVRRNLGNIIEHFRRLFVEKLTLPQQMRNFANLMKMRKKCEQRSGNAIRILVQNILTI